MEPSALKILLMLCLPVVVIGAPLLVGMVILWMWLKRSNRMQASRPFLGAAISGAVSFLSMLGAVGMLAFGSVRDRYGDQHPLWPVVMIGLFLLALATAFIAALFAVWMVWRLIATRAAPAPAQSAG